MTENPYTVSGLHRLIPKTATIFQKKGYDISDIPPYARYNKILAIKDNETRLIIISTHSCKPNIEEYQKAIKAAILDLSRLGYTIPMLHSKGVLVDLVLWYKDHNQWCADWKKDYKGE